MLVREHTDIQMETIVVMTHIVHTTLTHQCFLRVRHIEGANLSDNLLANFLRFLGFIFGIIHEMTALGENSFILFLKSTFLMLTLANISN